MEVDLSEVDIAALHSPEPGYVIGIDPATECGWAVLRRDGRRIASGCWDFTAKRHEGGGMRYLKARRLFLKLLEDFRQAEMVYEEVAAHKGTTAAHVYGGIVGQITTVCEELDPKVPYTTVTVQAVKRFATGRGNASKEDMVAAANKRWQLDLDDEDHNEADALWIAATWIAEAD